MTDPQAIREDYWTSLGDDRDDDLGDDPDRTTVGERIREEMDGRIHGIAVTARVDRTIYAVVAQSTELNGRPVVDLSTAVVDLSDETVKIHGDNGMWFPRSEGSTKAVARLLARTSNDEAGIVAPESPPVRNSGVDGVDPDMLMQRDLAPDEHDDQEADREWGFGAGPPPQIDTLIARFEEAGITTDRRFNLLQFGDKAPFDHNLTPKDDLRGNYGVYATADDALFLVDVDAPDRFDADLPPTFEVSSPHGSDARSHRYYYVEDHHRVRQRFGTYNLGPTWGEVRADNQYVVGPGSQLDGCDKPGCHECESPDGGCYRIVGDRPIARVAAEDLIAAVEDDPDVEQADDPGDRLDPGDDPGGQADRSTEDAPESGGDPDDVERVECYRCGVSVRVDRTTVYASDGDDEIRVCEGGCGR